MTLPRAGVATGGSVMVPAAPFGGAGRAAGTTGARAQGAQTIIYVHTLYMYIIILTNLRYMFAERRHTLSSFSPPPPRPSPISNTPGTPRSLPRGAPPTPQSVTGLRVQFGRVRKSIVGFQSLLHS